MLGFDVWFCLFAAVCSAVATVCVCICFACTVHMLHMSAMCLGKPTKGDRTIDRVRVNDF